jgi:hypothetical protein
VRPLTWERRPKSPPIGPTTEHRHHHGRRPDALSQGRNLRTLVEVLSDAGVPLGTAQEDIGQLANARNVAVHEGREMTDDELRPCLTPLTALLGKHGTRLT